MCNIIEDVRLYTPTTMVSNEGYVIVRIDGY